MLVITASLSIIDKDEASGNTLAERLGDDALFMHAGFITGQIFIVDGGMTRHMVYHADQGWSFTPNSDS